MNIVECVKELVQNALEECGLSTLHIDDSSAEPQTFGLAPLGDMLLKESVTGAVQQRQHTFMLYAAFSGINDYERLTNSGLLLDLALLLERSAGSFTHTLGESSFSGCIDSVTTANGAIHDVPLDESVYGIRYQLQIIVKYTLEEE